MGCKWTEHWVCASYFTGEMVVSSVWVALHVVGMEDNFFYTNFRKNCLHHHKVLVYKVVFFSRFAWQIRKIQKIQNLTLPCLFWKNCYHFWKNRDTCIWLKNLFYINFVLPKTTLKVYWPTNYFYKLKHWIAAKTINELNYSKTTTPFLYSSSFIHHLFKKKLCKIEHNLL